MKKPGECYQHSQAMAGTTVELSEVNMPATPFYAPPPGSETTAAETASLPCLFSNNCNDSQQEIGSEAPRILSTQQKKSACALAWNVQYIADRVGLERLGFLTLTFKEPITDPREAQRRFRSLRTGVLTDRYSAFIRVLERQKSRRIHYHLLVVMPRDIRTGFDFEAIVRRDYRSANIELRAEWAFWRRIAPRYGFGRTELLPIKSTAEGIARYVGKYIGKHLEVREEDDKGLRLVDYSRGGRMASTRFQFHTPNAREWRFRVRLFAMMTAYTFGVPASMAGLRQAHGRYWAHLYRDMIGSMPLGDMLEHASRLQHVSIPRPILWDVLRRQQPLITESGL
jgi:hypothetical protein